MRMVGGREGDGNDVWKYTADPDPAGQSSSIIFRSPGGTSYSHQWQEGRRRIYVWLYQDKQGGRFVSGKQEAKFLRVCLDTKKKKMSVRDRGIVCVCFFVFFFLQTSEKKKGYKEKT